MTPTKPLTLADFPIGASVWLRTGGPELLVVNTSKASRVLDTPDQAVVVWFIDKTLRKDVLPPSVLSLTRPVAPASEEDADD
jgi:hypothetical protein